MIANLNGKRVILGSGSPRRSDLLKGMGIQFEVVVKSIEESYPNHLSPPEVAEFLAKKKAKAFEDNLGEMDIVITADTIVSCDNRILNKPSNRAEAVIMLETLSGRKHEVITGVSIASTTKKVVFHSVTGVSFSQFTRKEIDYYLNNFQAMDKAGAYGIQDWIGLIGVENIEGSFYNVVGLPTNALFHHLKEF